MGVIMTLEKVNGVVIIVEIEKLFNLYNMYTGETRTEYADAAEIISFFHQQTGLTEDEHVIINSASDNVPENEILVKYKTDHLTYLSSKYLPNKQHNTVRDQLDDLVTLDYLDSDDSEFIRVTGLAVDDISKAIHEAYVEIEELIEEQYIVGNVDIINKYKETNTEEEPVMESEEPVVDQPPTKKPKSLLPLGIKVTCFVVGAILGVCISKKIFGSE